LLKPNCNVTKCESTSGTVSVTLSTETGAFRDLVPQRSWGGESQMHLCWKQRWLHDYLLAMNL